jgi:hypothetical protein
MSKDVSVEFRDDGEVIITKHRDTAGARETVAAMRRAIELFNKNDDDRPEAFDPDSDNDAPRTPEEEKERRRRMLAEAAEKERERSAAITATGVPPHPLKTRKVATMIDTDDWIQKIDNDLIEKIRKAGCGLAVLKRYVDEGRERWSEHQVAKILMNHWGKDFATNYQAQNSDGLLARRAIEKARNAAWMGI